MVELEGDTESVLAELATLRAQGFGALSEFFGLSAPALPPASSAPPPSLTSPALTLQFVLNQLLPPLHRIDYAFDIDGDGHPDNQFGNVFPCAALVASIWR